MRTLRDQLWVVALLYACGDDGADPNHAGRLDPDASVSDAAAAIDAASMHDAATDAATDAAAPFVPTGPVDGLPWGPSVVGIQDEGAGQDDTALVALFAPDKIAIEYTDDACFLVHTRKDDEISADVGTIRVLGGGNVATQALTRSPGGYYYLDNAGGGDPWQVGDAIRVEIEGDEIGPATLPTAFTSDNVAMLTEASRTEDLVVEATGSNGALIGLSLSGGTDSDSYLLMCTSDASTGMLVVPAEALAAFPNEVTDLHLKLQPANAVDADDVRLLAAGASASTDLTLEE